MNPMPGRPPSGGPRRSVLLTLAAAVLATHLWLLAGPQALAPVRAPGTDAPKAESRPLQTRLIAPTPAAAPPGAAGPAQRPAPEAAARASARLLAASTSVAPAPTTEPATEKRPQTTPEPMPVHDPEAAPDPPPVPGTDAAQSGQAATAPVSPAPPPESPVPAPALTEASADLPANAGPSIHTAPLPPSVTAAARADRAAPGLAPASATPLQPAPASTPPEASDATRTGADISGHHSAAGLQVDPARLPTPVLLNYDMRGQDRGLNYQASGELRWQHNDQHYALSLTVRALLLGSREWRSQGLVGPQGLQPLRFSDKRRTERATHFDHAEGRLVFSGNAPPVPLSAGAQDQVSLYVQLAAALASATPPLTAGSRVQVQTATTRDALPWLLTLERLESLSFEGRPLQTAYWVCLPRQRFDARIELWTSAEHQHLPARIRITQASGSFIDLQLRSQQSLPALPTPAAVGAKTTSP